MVSKVSVEPAGLGTSSPSFDLCAALHQFFFNVSIVVYCFGNYHKIITLYNQPYSEMNLLFEYISNDLRTKACWQLLLTKIFNQTLMFDLKQLGCRQCLKVMSRDLGE